MNTPPSAAELHLFLIALHKHEPGLVSIVKKHVNGSQITRKNIMLAMLMIHFWPWPIIATNVTSPIWDPIVLNAPQNTLRNFISWVAKRILFSSSVGAFSDLNVSPICNNKFTLRKNGILVAVVELRFVSAISECVDGYVSTPHGIVQLKTTNNEPVTPSSRYHIESLWGAFNAAKLKC
jgi:hypothetical protein